MFLEHNSQEQFYRAPFGAVPCGKTVRLALTAKDFGIPHYVNVLYKMNKGELCHIPMQYTKTVMGASVYEAEFEAPDKPCLIWYGFELKCDKGMFYYGNNSELLGGIGQMYDSLPEKLFQITVYDKSYKTSKWFSGNIAYQIFPDRFFKDGDFLSDREDIIKREWGETPFYKPEQFGGEFLANDFFGGNLSGIIKKLPYLSELGIGAIYLNPVFKAYSNHRYDTGDYEEIDPMLGTLSDFKKLCAEAKKLGIKIILDGVFNHTGSDSKYFNKKGTYPSVGAYQSENSEYSDWFRFSKFPDEYDSWWGMKTLPSVDEQSESLRAYLLNNEDAIVKKWIDAGASGWRLDVVDELPGFFVKELRAAVKSIDNEAVIIGEVWEDASNKESYGEAREYFQGFELDSVMNYPLKNALIDFACERIDAKAFQKRIMSLFENYPKQSFYSLLNMLSSHDSMRILTALSNPEKTDRDFFAGYSPDEETKNKAVLRLNAVLGVLMLMPGVPCIYYGDERGMTGGGDPFCRACVDWENKDERVFSIYKHFIEIRKSSDAFKCGDFKPAYAFGRVFGFLREDYVVLSNFGENHERIRLDVGKFKIFKLDDMASDNGVFYVDLAPFEVRVLNKSNK